jgi:hypothetical protein
MREGLGRTRVILDGRWGANCSFYFQALDSTTMTGIKLRLMQNDIDQHDYIFWLSSFF